MIFVNARMTFTREKAQQPACTHSCVKNFAYIGVLATFRQTILPFKPANMSSTPRTTAPFGPIALTFSGGGYRAAAFHLGSLSYLHHLGLLTDVEILSTVSGGSIVGAAYALSLKADEAFEDFFHRFSGIMLKANLISGALNKLGQPAPHTYAAYHNLITALAATYDEELFHGARMNVLYEGEDIHLKEIIFNAVEFKTGVAFRFLKSEDDQAIPGNHFHPITTEALKQCRIADVVAASSCFPGMFEPLIFPNDFHWPQAEVPLALQQKCEDPLPLMDGGIYDNQGIESAMLAIRRQQKLWHAPDYPGLVIVSDTDQPNQNICSVPPPEKKPKGLKIRELRWLTYAFGALSSLSFVFLLLQLMQRIRHDQINWLGDSLAFLLPLLLTALIPFGLVWMFRKIKVLKKLARTQVPQLDEDDWKSFNKLTIEQLLDMFDLRINSLLAMSSEVFLRQVRRLMYRDLYEDQTFKGKRVSNMIFETHANPSTIPWLKSSPKLQAITEAATYMPTTLWFHHPRELEYLLISGQATLCLNLLDRILLSHGDDPTQYPPAIRNLFEQAKADWARFQTDPHWLLKDMGMQPLPADEAPPLPESQLQQLV